MVHTHKKPDKHTENPLPITWSDVREYKGQSFAESNGKDGIPDIYEKETGLLESIGRRQKQFMKKSGDRESQFVTWDEPRYSEGEGTDRSAETNTLNTLFR